MEDTVYKITLSFKKKPGKRDMAVMSAAEGLGLLDKGYCARENINVIIEDGCIQIVSIMAGKKEGIIHICSKMGYKPEDIAVFGNSSSDIPMFKESGFSVAVDAGREASQAADYCIRSGWYA